MSSWANELVAVVKRFAYSLECTEEQVQELLDEHDELVDEFFSEGSSGKLFAWKQKGNVS